MAGWEGMRRRVDVEVTRLPHLFGNTRAWKIVITSTSSAKGSESKSCFILILSLRTLPLGTVFARKSSSERKIM